MTRRIWKIMLLTVLAAAANVASAGVISIEPVPDFNAVFLDITYDGSTYTVQGYSDSLTAIVGNIPSFFPISSDSLAPTFSLIAQISNTGVATSATLTVSGCVNDYPDSPGCPGSGLLLQSTTLQQFGFEPFEGGEVFFGFDGLSGALAPLFGDLAYVKINTYFAETGNSFPGDFSAPFNNSDVFSNQVDVGVTPEPATWLFLATGLGALCLARRRLRLN